MSEEKTLWMVVPCYNEEEVLPITARALADKIKELQQKKLISSQSRICFVDDGSADKTWSIIEELSQEEIFEGIKLSHNQGHQNALLAGLLEAVCHCDITISMDADLQDDVNAIEEMVLEYAKGNEIVYGVRNNRDTDTWFKRTTAELFYNISKICGVKLVSNSADFRLMSKKAVAALGQYKEVNLFLRGIVPMLGFQTSCVYYKRKERAAGESKYPLKKMLQFATEGITSFSIQPIKLIMNLGFFSVFVGVMIVIWSLVMRFTGNVVRGWTSIMASLWVLGGIQILAIGVIGEYIGKIYMETKSRPRYIVEKNTWDKEETGEA